MEHEFYPDKTRGGRFFTVFEQRLQLLEYLGVTPIKVEDYCHRLNYRQCFVDIIVSSDEDDLYRNYNESWWEMRHKVENFSEARLRGRDCYHAAKDICIDGLFADLIAYFMRKQHPDFDFGKNEQDRVFDLLPEVSLEPDFVVRGARLEMKITKTEKDGENRANWSKQTLTIRQNDLEAQLFSYCRYRPLWFLRINYEEKVYAVINYDDFKRSHKNDGTYFAYIKPIPMPADFRSFVDSLYVELSNKLH